VNTGCHDRRVLRRGVVRLSCLVSRVSCLLLLVGCRGLGKPDTRYDLLEAELRTRERELIEARAERDHLRLLVAAYQRQPVYSAEPPVHAGAPALPLREIALGRGTGGFDEDGRPGDEALQVVIVPTDHDGTAVKVPARVTVTAYEVSREGLKTCIGKWEVGPDQLRRTWRSGLLSSGYFVPLQWDRPPGTDRIRVVVQLTTLDGRPFEADRDVTVQRLPGIAPPPAVVPENPPGVEELPPPSGLTEPAARLRPVRPG
jgi:hypothetical protein